MGRWTMADGGEQSRAPADGVAEVGTAPITFLTTQAAASQGMPVLS